MKGRVIGKASGGADGTPKRSNSASPLRGEDSASQAQARDAADAHGRPEPDRLAAREELRQRYRCAGQLVRQVFRLPHDADPDLVTRDAYLVIVSSLIKAIVGPGNDSDGQHRELSVAELVSLSKALAEHRRVNTAQLQVERRFPIKAPEEDLLEGDLSAALPQHYVRMITQIYGVDIEKAWGSPPTGGVEADAGTAHGHAPRVSCQTSVPRCESASESA